MINDFSILIPAYNVDHYIEKCLNSIINQTYKKFEVVIIDDGSTDKTFSIIEKFKQKDKRIRVYRQSNSGIIYTRNRLLDLANGKWLVFIDADDYIKENYLACFIEYIRKNNKADVFVCDYVRWESGNVFKTYKKPFHDKLEYLTQLLDWRCTNTALWAKIIKKDLVASCKIRFEVGIVLGEDLCFMSRLFYYSNEIVYIPEDNYIWNRTNAFSITNSRNNQLDYILLYETIADFYIKKSDYRLFSKYLNNTMVMVIETLYLNCGSLSFGKLPVLIDKKQLTLLNKLKFYLIQHDFYKIELLVEKISRRLKRMING